MEEKRINVTSPSMPTLDEYVDEIRSIFDSHILTHQGPKHIELQEKLAQYLSVGKVELFANGHLALEIAIDALGLSGEIITTPFTFASTTQSILRNGIKPVFCDIEPENYTMDPDKIEALITDKTTAIIPVHVYGNVCNVEKIEEIAKKHGLKVIYDAAHAFGIKYKGKGIANYGDISMFSFHATKVFNTIEGGGLAFNDLKLDEKFKAIKQFGQVGETVPYIGTNAKMTEFNAAMGLCNLRHTDENIQNRKKAVERYRERLSGVRGIKICYDQDGVIHNYSYFPAVFSKEEFGKDRDEVASLLEADNIFARKYFYPLTSEFECVIQRYGKSDTPIAKDIANRVLTLPLYGDITIEDVDRICDVILGK